MTRVSRSISIVLGMHRHYEPRFYEVVTDRILRSVSRSFYLSIRFLPVQLREPIALAYLLARTTDTVADTAQISGSVRMETLKLLSNGIQGTASRDVVAELLHHLFRFRRTRANDNSSNHYPIAWRGWKEWSTQTATTFARCSKKSRAVRCSICNASIIRRRSARLGPLPISTNTPISLPVVSVNFGRDSVSGTFASSRAAPRTRCLLSGERYGMALQLINVLRDAGSDLRAGRCYFPEHELSAVHLTPSQILSEPERFQPIYRRWLENARAGLASGMEYSRAINNRRVRAATVLPALIGARTLALLNASGPRPCSDGESPTARSARDDFVVGLALASRKRIDAIFDRAKL